MDPGRDSFIHVCFLSRKYLFVDESPTVYELLFTEEWKMNELISKQKISKLRGLGASPITATTKSCPSFCCHKNTHTEKKKVVKQNRNKNEMKTEKNETYKHNHTDTLLISQIPSSDVS